MRTHLSQLDKVSQIPLSRPVAHSFLWLVEAPKHVPAAVAQAYEIACKIDIDGMYTWMFRANVEDVLMLSTIIAQRVRDAQKQTAIAGVAVIDCCHKVQPRAT